jgi:hypothetical protein
VSKKDLDDPPSSFITKQFCDERFLRVQEKIDNLKKTVYIAAAVTAFWITILNLILVLAK